MSLKKRLERASQPSTLLLKSEVRLQRSADRRRTIALIEKLCAEEGLKQKIKSTSATFPGSIHWHFNRDGSRGTLEITFWPDGKRLWLSVHANREGPWTSESMRRLCRAFELELGK